MPPTLKLTSLTIESPPLNPTEEERKTFDGAYEDLKQDWGGLSEQLATSLTKTRKKTP